MRFRHDSNDHSTLSSDRAMALLRDREGHLWIGTEDAGLNRLDESTQTFRRYRHHPNKPESLSSDSAWELAEGRDGSLWIGTMDGGLNRWSPDDRAIGRERFARFRKSAGLVSDTVFGILQADDRALWLSSNRGLSRFNPSTGEVRLFDAHHGLPHGEFNFGSRLRTRDGVMYFGSTDGLVAFNPDAVRENLHAPTVVVTARTQTRQLASRSSGKPDQTAVDLGFRESFLAFDFAGLDFASPDKNQYRYMLVGFDQRLVGSGQLPPGYLHEPAGRLLRLQGDGVERRGRLERGQRQPRGARGAASLEDGLRLRAVPLPRARVVRLPPLPAAQEARIGDQATLGDGASGPHQDP